MKPLLSAFIGLCIVIPAYGQQSTGIPQHKRTRAEIAAFLDSKSKQELIEAQLTAMFGPNLVGKQLPASVRNGKDIKDGQTLTNKKTTVVVFLSSACPHCIKEVPFLKELAAAAETNIDAAFIPVFFEEDSDGRSFLAEHDWKIQPATLTKQDVAIFPVHGTPLTVVANETGTIVASYNGEYSQEEMDSLRKFVAVQ